MSKLILCRHGETKLNKKDGEEGERIRGWLDIPLDAKGCDQADALAIQVSDYPIFHVYTSPLLRARETGRAIARHLGVPMSLDRALLPWNVGNFQGKPVKDVLPKMIELTKEENADTDAPGGESFRSFSSRFLKYLVANLARSKANGKTYCMVAHTRNLQLARAWEAAGKPADLSYDVKVMNDYGDEKKTGGLMVLDTEKA